MTIACGGAGEPGGVAHQHPHLAALVDQALGQVRTDEAGHAGHEHRGHGQAFLGGRGMKPLVRRT